MEIEKCRIGMKVRLTEGDVATGDVATIDELYSSGTVNVDYGPGSYHQVPFDASELTPVSDPCQECEMAATINRQCQKIAELQTALDVMTIKSNSAHRNARYWREELEKLQQEALSDSKPMSEVAKIYIHVSPAVLDMILKERD